MSSIVHHYLHGLVTYFYDGDVASLKVGADSGLSVADDGRSMQLTISGIDGYRQAFDLALHLDGSPVTGDQGGHLAALYPY